MKRKSAAPRKTKVHHLVSAIDIGPDYETRVLARLTPAQRDGFVAQFIVAELPDEDRKHVMTILRAHHRSYGFMQHRRGGAR